MLIWNKNSRYGKKGKKLNTISFCPLAPSPGYCILYICIIQYIVCILLLYQPKPSSPAGYLLLSVKQYLKGNILFLGSWKGSETLRLWKLSIYHQYIALCLKKKNYITVPWLRMESFLQCCSQVIILIWLEWNFSIYFLDQLFTDTSD